MIFDLENIPVQRGTDYPQPFKAMVEGRSRQRLGNAAGLTNFGVNLTTLEPGSASSLRHWHSRQDEFIYIVSGELVLVTDEGETVMKPGMMAAFPAGEANGHCLVNRTQESAVYLEVGDRTSGDSATYPDVDLLAAPTPQGYTFTHVDGTPYKS
ncbi:MAG: cupin domain-containing protein [Elainellaceae cyanobacterium]